ncbi:MAG: type II toxin-antitoxin system mRNA interferase toxin, RelE/StbE family [Gammaproteobacteria bacterium]|nr:type II toxin-antitoxin system mRNA interferase toxin, RelE/StbE family [Gammaproteobacteria bacterium]
MGIYEIRFTKEAVKDIQKLTPRLKSKLKQIIKNVIVSDPYSAKKLVGDLRGFYSLRLSYQNRIVYSIDETNRIIYIHKAKTHYAGINRN